MFIYKITNTINGKVYIGKTEVSVESRWKNHLSNAKGGWPQYLYNAIRKHGEDAFIVETLSEHETPDELCLAEIATIHLYRSNKPEHGYNMTDGGEGVAGLKWTEESRKKLSKSKKESTYVYVPSESHKKKLSEIMKKKGQRPPLWASLKGAHAPHKKIAPEIANERMKRAWATRRSRGWSPSLETRQKMRAAKLGKKSRPRSEKTKQAMREKWTEDRKKEQSIRMLGNKHNEGFKNALGHKHSEETRKLISQNNRRYQTEETRVKISLGMKRVHAERKEMKFLGC